MERSKTNIIIVITALMIPFLIACKKQNVEVPKGNVTIEEADALLKEGVKILDVRTTEEYKAGHIPGAINMSIADSNFQSNISNFARSDKYIIHCAANVPNGRTDKAIDILRRNGFENLYNLIGGYQAWAQAGMPTESIPN